LTSPVSPFYLVATVACTITWFFLMRNILTIDFEEYYQGILTIPADEYHRWPGRLESSAEKVLELLDNYGIKATFFVTGHVASCYPELVRRIHAEGHEVASHGSNHTLIYNMNLQSFREDLLRANEVIADCVAGSPILGYRAPWWSITAKTPWVWEVLESLGFRYDSSVNPIRMRFYGMPGAPLIPYRVPGTGLWEFPPATIELMKIRLSVAGGFYWRHYPLRFVLWALRRLNQQAIPAVCYFHPWELDTTQPRIKNLPLEQRIIHYSGRRSLEGKIRRILSEFSFGSFREVFGKEKGWI